MQAKTLHLTLKICQKNHIFFSELLKLNRKVKLTVSGKKCAYINYSIIHNYLYFIKHISLAVFIVHWEGRILSNTTKL